MYVLLQFELTDQELNYSVIENNILFFDILHCCVSFLNCILYLVVLLQKHIDWEAAALLLKGNAYNSDL